MSFLRVLFYPSSHDTDMPPKWREKIQNAHLDADVPYPYLTHVSCVYLWSEESPLLGIDIGMDGTSIFVIENTEMLDWLYDGAMHVAGSPCYRLGDTLESFITEYTNKWTINKLAYRHLVRNTYTKDTVSCTSFARAVLPNLTQQSFTAGGLYYEMRK
jgi:5,10-methenyltetrahydromethanopterin hydrogenase